MDLITDLIFFNATWEEMLLFWLVLLVLPVLHCLVIFIIYLFSGGNSKKMITEKNLEKKIFRVVI